MESFTTKLKLGITSQSASSSSSATGLMGRGSSKLCRLQGDELIELVECTGLNQSILRRWHREFQVDFPRGFFTREELKHVYGDMFPDGHPDAFLDFVFNAMDRRRIGLVFSCSPASTHRFHAWIRKLSLRIKNLA